MPYRQTVNVKYGTDIESAVLKLVWEQGLSLKKVGQIEIFLYFRNIETQMNQITVILK
jgi:hypothetical protein